MVVTGCVVGWTVYEQLKSTHTTLNMVVLCRLLIPMDIR